MGAPRPRPAPPQWPIEGPTGILGTFTLTGPTVVVVVKADCDGCRSFFHGAAAALAPATLHLVTRDDPALAAFSGAEPTVWRATALLDELAVRWPPVYLLLAPDPPRVLSEGVVFSPEQVRAELEPYLET